MVYSGRWLTISSSTGFGHCGPLSHTSRLYAAFAATDHDPISARFSDRSLRA